MLRVGDLDRAIAFYTEVLGMKMLRRSDYPDGRFTNVFVGYDDEARVRYAGGLTVGTPEELAE